MLGKNRRRSTVRTLLATLLAGILGFIAMSCGSPQGSFPIPGLSKPPHRLSEVAPPQAIRELRQALESYQPQVKILSPRSNDILQDTTVSVKLQVNDLPIFKDKALELGPHLQFILDNQPYEAIYDASQPIVLEDLDPGTHTIRVFASRPWHESFKNEGAYAQTTFHLFTKTPEHNPDPTQPLLTYSRPKGSYGAEPVMLDFYLTNAPLHVVAMESPDDEILDWQIRCTIDGESFIVDRWEPIYLNGLKPGKNWVQLELLDEKGNPYPNAFNNTVRVITYEPGGTDTLSKLTRGELLASEAFGIIDPNYVPPPPEPVIVPEPEPVPEPESSPIVEPELPTEPESLPEDMPTLEPFPTTAEPGELPEIETPTEAPIEQNPEETPIAPITPIAPVTPIVPIPEPTPEAIDSPIVEEKIKEQLPAEVEQQLEELESLPAEESSEEAPDSLVPLPTAGEPALTIAPLPPFAPTPEPAQDKSLVERTKTFFNRLLQRSPEPAVSPSSSPLIDIPLLEPTLEPLEEPIIEPEVPFTQEELPTLELPNTLQAPTEPEEVEPIFPEPEPSSEAEQSPDPSTPSRYQPPFTLSLPTLLQAK
ncbi:MAG: hypothetical protein HC769_06095 [Cyanobacteria bacterium CRU_2_1]|nr:hypothetical protein [Cyanobacteria bacterium RU_5_0]NJR58457.1 hypothetical protein [Cyanobacteria bacterium CRU_2_1]